MPFSLLLTKERKEVSKFVSITKFLTHYCLCWSCSGLLVGEITPTVIFMGCGVWFGLLLLLFPSNGEEKSLRRVVMVAKFLDDNKPKTSLNKWIRTVWNLIDPIQFHLICQMLVKFSGVESDRTVSEVRKRKRKFLCCVLSLRLTLGSFTSPSCNDG